MQKQSQASAKDKQKQGKTDSKPIPQKKRADNDEVLSKDTKSQKSKNSQTWEKERPKPQEPKLFQASQKLKSQNAKGPQAIPKPEEEEEKKGPKRQEKQRPRNQTDEDVEMEDQSEDKTKKLSKEVESIRDSSKRERKSSQGGSRKRERSSGLSIKSFQSKQVKLESLIEPIEKADSGKRIKFKEPVHENGSNKMCQACMQYIIYDSIDNEDSSEEEESIDANEKEAQCKFLMPQSQPLVLYTLVYCQECNAPVHWNCLGEKTRLFEYKPKQHSHETYLLFLCQKCDFKQKNRGFNENNITCVVCNQKEGFMKVTEGKSGEDGEKDFIFYHPICAMTQPQFFFLHNPQLMDFKLSVTKDEIIAQYNHNQGRKKTCMFCNSSNGILQKCFVDDCGEEAHTFCIFNKLKDYYFDYTDELKDPEALHKMKWSYYIYYDKDTQLLEHRPLCQNHYEANFYTCYCHQKGSIELVMCDSCQAWYHDSCLVEFRNEDEDKRFMCKKCRGWRDQLQFPILDAVLTRKQFQEFINQDRTQWEFGSLLPENQESLYPEQRIFEQILYAKAWWRLAYYLDKNEVSEEIINNHLKVQKQLLLNCWFQQNQLTKKIEKAHELEEDEIKKLGKVELKDLVDVKRNKINENEKHNLRLVESVIKVIEKCKSESKVITKSIKDLERLQDKSKILQEAASILTDKEKKPLSSKVQELLEFYEAQNMTEYQSYTILQKLNEEYLQWDQKSIQKFFDCGSGEGTIANDLKALKHNRYGVKLQEERYNYFKEVLSKKITVEDANKFLEQSNSLNIDVSEEVNQMKQIIGDTLNLEKQMLKIEKSNKKPAQNIYKTLIKICAQPVRTPGIYGILDRWLKSAIWNQNAQDFSKDKLHENLAYVASQRAFGEDKMDVDEGDGADSPDKQNFIWTLKEAHQLVNNKDKEVYYDQLLYNKVLEKIQIIEKLQGLLPKALQSNHDLRLLKEYLKELKEIENFDFSAEIKQVETKIKTINEVQQVIERDGKTKHSLEDLERLVQTIDRISNKQNNPHTIKLDDEMVMMLRAKLKIAQDLKKRFYDILNQNQDTFSKQMHSDLKKVITDANKDQLIEMKQEQTILNNVPASEDWFLQTQDKLKKIAGKMLNTVDFKDFIQLSTVVQDDKDVDSLLKSKMPPELLVGAAQNLWKSLSGVKWLIELRKLIQVQSDSKVELQAIVDLDQRAKQLGIDYDEEAAKENVLERYFVEISKLVKSVNMFLDKFGSTKKIVKTLDQKYEEMLQDESVVDDFKQEITQLIDNLDEHKVSQRQIKACQITSKNGELNVLSKLHTWLDFLRYYKQLAQQYENKLPYNECMLLSQQARENELPDEIRVVKELKEKVQRFEKFNREYNDYKRFRERIKKEGYSLSSGVLDIRFTGQLLRKLIEESKNLALSKDHDDAFDEDMLKCDLKIYEEWKSRAQELLQQLTQDDMACDNPEVKANFIKIKTEMRKIPVYDRDTFVKVQVFDWLFSVLDMFSIKEGDEPKSIGTWEAKLKHIEQFQGVMGLIKNHRVYQMILFEIEQARSVIEFVTDQKTNQKSLAAKFNMDKQQNYAYFRNKVPVKKIQDMLTLAKQCKIDVLEEARCLDQWLKDYRKYTTLDEEGKLVTDFDFEKLRDITKQMYLSPIDYEETYFKLREKIDTAEMIRLNLKKTFQEYEQSLQSQLQENQKVKRLRYSRISYDLKLFQKSCNIKGIKEIDQALEKVKKSQEKLEEIKSLLNEVANYDYATQSNQIRNILEKGKVNFSRIELDMEQEEVEVRRLIFEAELRLVLINENNYRIKYEEFQDFEKEFDKLRNSLKDDQVHSKFLEVRNKVHDIIRELKKVDNKKLLDEITAKVESECPFIDFTQVITDKDAQILLGKRKRDQLQIIDETKSQPKKRQKVSQSQGSIQKEEISSDNEASESEESDSNSISSDSGSDSDSSSSSGSSSSGSGSDGSSESDDESSEEEGNIAKNRARRRVVPNLNSDFVYAKPAVSTIKRIQNQARKDESPEQSQSSAEVDEEEAKRKKIERKNQRKLEKKNRRLQKEKEKEKKKQMKKQLHEHRLKQGQIQQQKQKSMLEKFEYEQPIQLSTQIAQDKGLQNSLQMIKNRIREQSRQQIKQALDSTQVFQSMTPEEKKEFILEIETDVHQRNPEVDHFYRKKITDCCDNIKFLQNHKDVAELIVRKALHKFKLLQPHHSFKDNTLKIAQNMKEKRQQDRLKERQQQQLQQRAKQEQEKRKQDNDVQIPKDQNLMSAIYPSNRQNDQLTTELMAQKFKTSDSDESDLESLDGNQGIFSDDEDAQLIQARLAQQSAGAYDPFQSSLPTRMPEVQYGQMPGLIGQMPYIPQKIQYNPYEILEQRLNRSNQKKVSEPILYDPHKERNLNKNLQEKNVAPPGSLLKVWEGQLDLTKDNPSCTIYSSADIQIFQTLPEIPQVLPLKGKSKIAEVTAYFNRLKNDKRLIRGWLVRRGNIGQLDGKHSGTSNWQENTDRYTKLFEELEQTEKSALFNVFQGLTFYIVPITAKTKDFCQQMGIEPETETPVQNGEDNLQNTLSQETHVYALLGQIKQQFPKQALQSQPICSKLSFCNPEVLRRVEAPQAQGNIPERIASPITSDEEDNNVKVKQQLRTNIKTEDLSNYSQQRPIVKQDENERSAFEEQVTVKQCEDQDEIDIDDLIRKFKSEDINVNTIQATLLPIIHKVKGDKEAKLTQFLQELIQQQLNNQSSQPPAIKQENYQPQPTPYTQSYMPFNPSAQPTGLPQQRFPPGQVPSGQFMGMNPSQIRPMMGGLPPQVRPNLPGAIYPTSQIPQMNMQIQQATQQFQQRQPFPPQMQHPGMFPQQPGIGLPQLRPPSGIPQNQMIMPPGMLPQQQQFSGMPPRMMGQQPPQNQQQQQFRPGYPNQQQQQKR